MKLKTLFLLAVGYVVGAKLGPQQLENVARAALEPTSDATPLALGRSTESVPAASWPDPGFSA